jgi:two-component system, OmpR family, response regulator MtrA
MASSARTLSFPTLNPVMRSDAAEEHIASQHRAASVIVVVGGAADDGELLRAARRADAVTLVAPDLETARAWLGLPAVPSPPSVREDGMISLDGLVLDLRVHEARWRGSPLDLTPLELRLLAALAEQPATAWSFAALAGRVWGSNHSGDRSMVRSAIYRLRRKLARAGVTSHILAVRGMGFRLLHPLPQQDVRNHQIEP